MKNVLNLPQIVPELDGITPRIMNISQCRLFPYVNPAKPLWFVFLEIARTSALATYPFSLTMVDFNCLFYILKYSYCLFHGTGH